MSRFKQADLSKVKTVSLRRRRSKAEVSALGKSFEYDGAREFLDSLPRFLKAAELIEFINRIAAARRRGFPFHIMMGAHVIKVGLSPIIIDLIQNGIVTGLSLNSAGLIHDLELAFVGRTSEEVAAGLKSGDFGMAKETGELFSAVIELAEKESLGLGEAAGHFINRRKAKYRDYSVLAAADKNGIPATVHIVIGTDIVSQQPAFKAGLAAEASYRDFKILSHLLINADRGGVIANIGSAVVLPEVFLKALTVARNLNKHKCNITTANFDMIAHYRPLTNVVQRPTYAGGRGFNFIGHHEIMGPLLAWGLKSLVTNIK
ncbi:MAG: hypothetical protein NTV06_03380 [candidate division Zixibacteria bacterium]|nr:hypothetical protein [candidate division Zixibacteria bacterium]